jgi:hypothetical protein
MRVLRTDPLQSTHSHNTFPTYWSTSIHTLRQYVSHVLIRFNPPTQTIRILRTDPLQSTHSDNTCPTYWSTSIHPLRQYVSYVLIHFNPPTQTIRVLCTDPLQSTALCLRIRQKDRLGVTFVLWHKPPCTFVRQVAVWCSEADMCTNIQVVRSHGTISFTLHQFFPL